MRLDVTRALKEPGTTFHFEGTQEIPDQDVNGSTVTFDPAEIAGTYQALDDGSIIVDGTVTVVAHSPCANCLEPAQSTVSNVYRETFIHDGDPEDDEIFTYTSSAVDFSRLVLSYVMMALPMRFLCKEDCQGWRQYWQPDEPAEEKEDKQYPFAALQQLLQQKEEE